MGELTPELRGFLDTVQVGVLATSAQDGRPRQSVVYFARDGDDLLISTLGARRKAKDVERSGWASLCVMALEPPYASATYSGSAEILTSDIGVPTAAVVQRVTGLPEPPEPQTDEALAAVDRVVLRIAIERVTAVTHMETR